MCRSHSTLYTPLWSAWTVLYGISIAWPGYCRHCRQARLPVNHILMKSGTPPPLAITPPNWGVSSLHSFMSTTELSHIMWQDLVSPIAMIFPATVCNLAPGCPGLSLVSAHQLLFTRHNVWTIGDYSGIAPSSRGQGTLLHTAPLSPCPVLQPFSLSSPDLYSAPGAGPADM